MGIVYVSNVWPCEVKTVKYELKKKETGTKTVAIATSNYALSDVFRVFKCTYEVSIALPHSFQTYS